MAAVVVLLAGCTMDGGFGPTTGSGDLESQALRFVVDEQMVDAVSAVLYAGQTINVGTVDLSMEDNILTLTYNTTGDWVLQEVHMAIGLTFGAIPTNRAGNPTIGLFPYAATGLGGVSSYSFSIPLEEVLNLTEEELDGKSLYIAAHAVVSNPVTGSRETAWGAGERITGRGNWATFFVFTLVSDEGDGPGGVISTETAFAYGGDLATSFLEFDGANRWGWTNGPLSAGSYTFDIYAGAGQSDITKGTLVGSLSVSYDGSIATVTYSMLAGFTMTEVHLHVGNEVLPVDRNGSTTLAPGQYQNKAEGLDDVSEYTAVITGLSGDVHVVAHAVVAGEF